MLRGGGGGGGCLCQLYMNNLTLITCVWVIATGRWSQVVLCEVSIDFHGLPSTYVQRLPDTLLSDFKCPGKFKVAHLSSQVKYSIVNKTFLSTTLWFSLLMSWFQSSLDTVLIELQCFFFFCTMLHWIVLSCWALQSITVYNIIFSQPYALMLFVPTSLVPNWSPSKPGHWQIASYNQRWFLWYCQIFSMKWVCGSLLLFVLFFSSVFLLLWR